MLNFISFRAIPHVMKQNDFSCDPHMGSSLASTTVSMYAVVEQIKQHNVMSKSFKTKIFNICFKKTQKRKLPFFLILCEPSKARNSEKGSKTQATQNTSNTHNQTQPQPHQKPNKTETKTWPYQSKTS